jgi:glycogen debranching enzyme
MIARITGPGHEITTYDVADGQMSAGSTLGGPKATMLIKATGAIERLWSIEAGADMFGTLVVHHWDVKTGIPLSAQPGDFAIHPDRQEHLFELSNGITVHEDLFVLSGKPEGKDFHDVDPPSAYYEIRLTNQSEEAVHIATYGAIQLKGSFDGCNRVTYDKKHHAFVVRNDSAPDVVRYAVCSKAPTSYEVTQDVAKVHAASFPGELSGETLDSDGDAIGLFHLDHHIAPGQSVSWFYTLTFTTGGEQLQLVDCETSRRRTRAYYDEILDRAVVVTPDREVNRGVLWAKANMLRMELLAPQGWCFTNDPTRSNNSVCRDTCWFAFGSDYVTPHFSKESLLWYVDHLEPKGMAVEYYDIRSGKTEDYGLNINDNTPLLVLALWHHYAATGDRDFLEHVYPNVKRIVQYILSQRDERGLVWCTADGTGERGIVGWRNVIKGYRLAGATTELNSECYAAMMALATFARELGDDAAERSALGDAERLREAINKYLLDKERNIYYLNIGADGEASTDVTSDLVFPIMFRVADQDTSANIISRLSVPEFWKEPGIHTVPRTAIRYSPAGASGLLGGIWAGVTYWYAFAAAAFNPEFMAQALHASFKHYAIDPRHNNTVPGQFSEWLHGETLVNQGMMLSPWYPPRYLWAAIEGLAGLDVSSNTPCLQPRLSRTWKWIGVRNVPIRGKDVSWFVVRLDDLSTYSSYPFDAVPEDRRYDADISDCAHISGEEVVVIVLERADRVAVLLGNTHERTAMAALRLQLNRAEQFTLLRTFNSLRGEWVEDRSFDVARFEVGYPVQVDRQGFCILELHRGAA